MADSAPISVSEDLDALRRSLDLGDDLGLALARFLAACSGTLRAHAATAHRDEAAASARPRTEATS